MWSFRQHIVTIVVYARPLSPAGSQRSQTKMSSESNDLPVSQTASQLGGQTSGQPEDKPTNQADRQTLSQQASKPASQSNDRPRVRSSIWKSIQRPDQPINRPLTSATPVTASGVAYHIAHATQLNAGRRICCRSSEWNAPFELRFKWRYRKHRPRERRLVSDRFFQLEAIMRYLDL